MLLKFPQNDKSLPTTSKGGNSAAGSYIEISDFQERVREYNLFCQSCHHKWEAGLPKTYSVYRCPCPNCKCDTHGNVLATLERY
jgi:hypothetical protein